MDMLPQDIRIERAKAGDLKALCRLLSALFSIEKDFTPNTDRQEAGLKLLLQHPDHAIILVARDSNGCVFGMVTAQRVFSTAEGAPSVWIEDMVIDAPHRRRGIGRALLDHVLEWTRTVGATRAQLLVDLDNPPALEFYQRLGWQSTRLSARRIILAPPDR
jgi:GNAT superfamily N-acetyltransferase